jgi:hypothetical protein
VKEKGGVQNPIKCKYSRSQFLAFLDDVCPIASVAASGHLPDGIAVNVDCDEVHHERREAHRYDAIILAPA